MDKKLFEGLMKSFDEAIAYSRGELELKTTISNVKVSPVPKFTASEIYKIRNNIRLSQTVFADVLGVSRKTIEAWERGTNSPNGPACRLLKRFEENPKSVEEYLRRA